MKFILIPTTTTAPTKWTAISVKRQQELAALTSSEERSKYLARRPSWNHLKRWLSKINHNKCWYCEAICLRFPADVDHFRPKLGTTVDRVLVPGHQGYHWLAYSWTNYRYSCIRCNRPEKDDADALWGKANEFPIRDEAQRCATPVGALSLEEPALLDPCVEADTLLLAHALDGEVKPFAAQGTWEYERATRTIKTLGLNAFGVPEQKKKRGLTLATLLSLVDGHPSQAVLDTINTHLSDQHEYLSFFRAAIGTHRDKPWVEALL
jgi:uncharacterized protein (TIGR02646 family)